MPLVLAFFFWCVSSHMKLPSTTYLQRLEGIQVFRWWLLRISVVVFSCCSSKLVLCLLSFELRRGARACAMPVHQLCAIFDAIFCQLLSHTRAVAALWCIECEVIVLESSFCFSQSETLWLS